MQCAKVLRPGEPSNRRDVLSCRSTTSAPDRSLGALCAACLGAASFPSQIAGCGRVVLRPPRMCPLRAHRELLIFLPGRCARPALCGFSSAGSAASALAHRVEVTTLLRDRCYAVHEFGVKGFRVGYLPPSVFLLRFLRFALPLLGSRRPLYPSYIQTDI